MPEKESSVPPPGADTPSERYYRELLGKNFLRLALTYLAPLILLTVYFTLQYRAVSREGRRLHLRSVAEHQANMMDLFLSERVVNLANLIDDPKLPLPPTSGLMEALLNRLQKNSPSFVDVGFFDSTGIQRAYAGPLPYLENRNYSHEAWFISLRSGEENFIITDVYLGLRQQPHFTLAVRRIIGGQYFVLRATLDPKSITDYLHSLGESRNTAFSIVNRSGTLQLATPEIGTPMQASPLVPPVSPRIGDQRVRRGHQKVDYAYAWMRTAGWGVVVRDIEGENGVPLLGNLFGVMAFSLAPILVVLSIIVFRSKKLVQMQIERETAKAQFEHAAKLASVGELSAGIAHEINNPLAIISEEVGLIRDLMNPEFKMHTTFDDLIPHLDNIREAVYRCRDITRKLLSFVRKDAIHLKPHDVNQLLDDVVDGLLIREMAVSNIQIVKNYSCELPSIVTDANQLTQVLLNILNNAADAIEPPGAITIATSCASGWLSVAIADTGKGITQEMMGRIFLPFYTTKEVGKGTGLGLSVSYGIVKSLGGDILVESIPGKGSVFTVRLPVS
ncbi:MAG: sensor histidine kinase [Candidatus Zixiibacteriota bacterium]|nr:MAG: sensor histidine kinase [candidate division Zixibacteria bacterium]